jgi:PadR family transcriptional regulator PadR
MDIQNTQSQMRKGVLEFCILSIIRQGETTEEENPTQP